MPEDSDVMLAAQLRDELDRSRSMLSALAIDDAASIATSCTTNYTQPLKWNAPDNVSLIGDGKFVAASQASIEPVPKFVDNDGEPENHWIRRNKNVARAPLENSLIFPKGKRHFLTYCL